MRGHAGHVIGIVSIAVIAIAYLIAMFAVQQLG